MWLQTKNLIVFSFFLVTNKKVSNNVRLTVDLKYLTEVAGSWPELIGYKVEVPCLYSSKAATGGVL